VSQKRTCDAGCLDGWQCNGEYLEVIDMMNQRDIDATVRDREIAVQRQESLKLQAHLEKLIKVDKDIARAAHETVRLLKNTKQLAIEIGVN